MTRLTANVGGVVAIALTILGLSAAGAAGTPLRWSSQSPITSALSESRDLVAMSCPTSGLCVALDATGRVLWATTPASTAAWTTVASGVPRVASPNAMSCSSASLCVAVQDNQVYLSDSPTTAGSWHAETVAGENEMQSVSCPSDNLCVAGGMGLISTTTDPRAASPAWRTVAVSGAGTGYGSIVVACPAVSECVGVDDGRAVYSSTDPAGGGAAWHNAPVSAPSTLDLDDVACAGANLCVASGETDGLTDVAATSTTPVAGGWQLTTLPADGQVSQSESCPSSTLCLIGQTGGDVYASDDPAAGDWSVRHIAGSPDDDLSSVGVLACAGPGTCLAADEQDVFASFDAARTWEKEVPDADVTHRALTEVTCPSATLCLAIDTAGDLFASTHGGATGTWRQRHLDRELEQFSCPSSSLCVAVSDDGDILSTRSPAAGAWHRVVLAGGPLTAIACPSPHLCLAGDGSEDIYETTDPPGPASGWQHRPLPGNGDTPTVITAITCPTARFCAAVDAATGTGEEADVFVSRTPAQLRSWRRVTDFAAGQFAAVACPTVGGCLAAGGTLAASGSPAQRSTWHRETVPGATAFTAVSCASPAFCVAADTLGGVESSSNPLGTRARWTRQPLEPLGNITSLTCPTSRRCVAVDDSGRVWIGAA